MSKRADQETQKLAYRLLPGEIRFETKREGAHLSWSRYPAVGQPRGTVVLLHGVASNGSRWEEFMDTTRLHQQWDIVRMDLRGHAASVCRKRCRIEDWCSDIAIILDVLKLTSAVVVGHSLGAQVAMNFAAAYPDRCQALALLDPLVSDALTEKAQGMRKKVPVLKIGELYMRFANALGFTRKLLAQDLREMDRQARVKIGQGGKELQAFIAQYSSARADLQYIHSAPYMRDLIEVGRATPQAQLIRCPALVIGSSSGAFTDEQKMAQWVKAIPQGEMRSVHCAHWPMTECPQEVSEIIARWVDSLAI